MIICDSHAHLNHQGVFDRDRQAVLERAWQAGVGLILNVATGLQDACPTVREAERHPALLAAVGIHPHEAGQLDDTAMETLERLSRSPEVVAWGEIGLDFHYLHAPVPVQEHAFARQLQMAARLRLPVSVHTRVADEATLRLLRTHLGPAMGVI
ncbi:MAG: TatD family hydrolase, partial [Acidobacteriota bacterium]